MRIGRRERHKLLLSAQDYFYRHILIPAVAKVVVLQTIAAIILLVGWTTVGRLLDTIFIHCYAKMPNTFLQDFSSHFSFASLRDNPWIVPGSVFLSTAASWNYLRTLRVPPPLEPNRLQKITEFLRMLSLNGPVALACVAVSCIRPNIPFFDDFGNSEDSQNLNQTSDNSIESINAETIPTASEKFLWEIVLKTLMVLVIFLIQL